MRTIGLSVAMGLALSALFAPAANAQQQPTIFFCAAPAGHVCQFAVQTGAAPIDFALPSVTRTFAPLRAASVAMLAIAVASPMSVDSESRTSLTRPSHGCASRPLRASLDNAG